MKQVGIFFTITVFWMLIGCNSTATVETSSTKTPILTNAPSPSLTATVKPTITSTRTSTLTPTPTQINIDFLHTSLDQSGEWEFELPYVDSSLPNLIIESSEGYYLDPSFEVSEIDMSYEWWGLSDPVFDFQHIEQKGNRYWLGDSVIATDAILSLIQSINHLHPEPQMLTSITHTDDYPIWAIELRDKNGVSLLIYSNSNTPDFSPWNVVFNGRIFSQFDGQISKAIASIFSTDEGQPMAWTEEGKFEEGYLSVETSGKPQQMVNGFNGLIAIQSGFNYWPNPELGVLSGYFKGRSSIGGMGNMIIGSITELNSIEIKLDENNIVNCDIEALSTDDPAAYVWEFECPVGKSNRDYYHYPIQVFFSTDEGKSYSSEGNLFGYWDKKIQLPIDTLPEEIDTILLSSDEAKDLLQDHQLMLLDYEAFADPVSGLVDHEWSGDLVLLGQAEVNDRILKYSVTLRVKISNSKLIEWDLDRDKLLFLLQKVLRQPITQHFLENDPNLVLNLYYGESEPPILSSSFLPDCADLPGSDGLPRYWRPLYGFAFNSHWDFAGVQVVLIDEKPRLVDFYIQPSRAEDAPWVSLLPDDFTPREAPPFTRIGIWPWSPTVVLTWDENSDEQALEVYKEIASNWDGNKEVASWGIMFHSATFGFTKDGKLELVNCDVPTCKGKSIRSMPGETEQPELEECKEP